MSFLGIPYDNWTVIMRILALILLLVAAIRNDQDFRDRLIALGLACFVASHSFGG